MWSGYEGILQLGDPGKRLTILTPSEIQQLYGLPSFLEEERIEYEIALNQVLLRGQRTLRYFIDEDDRNGFLDAIEEMSEHL